MQKLWRYFESLYKESYSGISFDQRIKTFGVFKKEDIEITVVKSNNDIWDIVYQQ